jgi:hypothetical protein
MTEKYKPWTDANGQYFSWLEELWALDAEKKARGDSQEYSHGSYVGIAIAQAQFSRGLSQSNQGKS